MEIVFFDSTTAFLLKNSASNTKVKIMVEAFQEKCETLVIDNLNGISYIPDNKIKNGIQCVYFPSKNILRNYYKAYKHLKKTDTPFIITSSARLSNIVFFIILRLLMKFKLLYLFHEYHSSLETNKLNKGKGYIFDNTFAYICNAILPISEYLTVKSLKFNKPIFKVPILYQYDNALTKIETANKSFTYCGHIGYRRVIDIIIQAFVKLNIKDTELNMILYGADNEIKALHSELIKYKNIRIIQNLSNKDLQSLYKKSTALLIPLDEKNEQDKARFSQKIAEYLASGRPIITVNVGEIPFYFEDMKNAFICKSLSPENITEKMKFCLDNKEICDTVGYNGYLLGREKFESSKCIEQLYHFLQKI